MTTLQFKYNPKITLLADAATTDDGTSLTFGVVTEYKPLEKISPSSFISTLISLVLIISIIVFIGILLTGGLKWITSSGDEKKLATARSQITNALVGILIVFSSWAILGLIEVLFGINILNLPIPSFKTPTG